jgi:hypothetical protein
MKAIKKMKTVKIDTEYRNYVKTSAIPQKITMTQFVESAIDVRKHLTEQAEIGGVAKEQTQEFIDWLLDNQSFQDQIIEHAGVFVKSQKAIEEALHKD